MPFLTLFANFIFLFSDLISVKAQLFESFLMAKNSGLATTCSNHFIGADIILCGSSLTHESSVIQVLSDGYQMTKLLSVEDCFRRMKNFNLIQFKKTVVIFTPENELELQAIANQGPNLLNTPVNNNSTILVIINWTIIMVSKKEENAFEKSLESLASQFLLNEYVFLLYRRRLPDGSLSATILELYSIKNITFVLKVPHINKIGKLDCYFFAATGWRRTDFKGAVIAATAVDSEANVPVVTYKDTEDAEFIDGLGVYDLWDIRELLNFSIKAVKGSSDITVDNGTVGGIGRQLLEDEADVSILHSYTLPSYVYHLTPLLPLGADRVYAFFIQPPTSSVRDIFQKPFKTDLWMSLIVAWLLIVFCIFTIGYLEKQIHQYNDEDETLWPLEETNLWAVSIIGQRSMSFHLILVYLIHLPICRYFKYHFLHE